ncbi:MAG: PIN domain-containing protein [Roseburia hominis]|uniref:PIN domain-containing protein n=1 Tax=Roseburia hominis TaxID=301301 RepID=UPI002908C462|nr:PIN domain-containing protein [Roseburia hominis]MDU6922697.1 PIN domain-containing protein [Roseburia hominis]
MGKIYLVDSENVGDIWVPLLVSSQEDDEVLVFYTTKSPHMNYENVRMLKETEKEADFIKCFEGSNALDFQLVSELGYRLSQNADREYVIVSNDTGFDAAVRYWSTRKMPVSRLSGKECHRMLTEKKQRVAKESGAAVEPEQEQTRAAGPEVEAEQVRETEQEAEAEQVRETGQEAEAEQVRETGQEAEAERGREQSKKPRSSKKSEPSKAGGKAGESGKPEASGKAGNAETSGKAEVIGKAEDAEKSGKAEPTEKAGLAGESGKPEVIGKAEDAETSGKAEVTGKAEDAETSGKPEVTGKAEDAETSGKSESAEKAGLAEKSGKAEPAEKTGRAKRSRKSAKAVKAEKSEHMSEPDRSEKSQKSDKAKTQNAGNEKPDLTEEQSGQMTAMMDLKEEMSENPQSVSNATGQSEAPAKFGLDLNAERAILKTLCACISKENLVDFHNALVALLGEEEGKRLYQELKTNAEYASYWSELPAYGLKEKFDMYCKMVFDHSEYAKEPPEDFSGFLYQANGKRKNLNSLRAALQGHYGKDKGMKYYSLFKSHIKMMNRM